MCSLFVSRSKSRMSVVLKNKFAAVFLFIVLFIVGDRCLFLVLDYAFWRTTTGETTGGIVNRLRQEKADIIIFGSSRAVTHYDSQALSSRLNMSVYNAGCNGVGLHYVRGVVDLSLKQNKPILAIINIDIGSYYNFTWDLSNAKSLAPFMDKSDVIREMLCSEKNMETLRYSLLTYRFNGKPLAIVKNLFVADQTIAGFTPLYGFLNPEKAIPLNPENSADLPEIDSRMMDLMKKIISQLRESGVHTVLVVSPLWRRDGMIEHKRKAILQEVRELAEEEQTPFLAVTIENTPVFQRSELFKDPRHLNAEGARLFSEIVAEKIASLMANQFHFVCEEL